MKSLTAMMVVAPLAGIVCFASPSTVDQFKARYRNAKTLSITFLQDDGARYMLFATKAGSYRLQTPTNTILSNGTTIWNISPRSKSVIINTVSTHAGDASVQQVFFAVMNVYTATLVPSVKKGMITIELAPPAENAVVASIRRVRVTMKKNFAIQHMWIESDMGLQNCSVLQCSTTKKIPQSMFEPVYPANFQVVDLRVKR
jgi:outer membrane lipoprotein-sorting protein